MFRTIEFLGHHISKKNNGFHGIAVLSQKDDHEESDVGHGGNC